MDKTMYKVGFRSAFVAFVASAGFSIAQILQIIGLISYPWDEVLIYGFSLFIAAPFMLALLALHYVTPDEKKFWSHAAVLFAVMYVTYVSLNYIVQLTADFTMTQTQFLYKHLTLFSGLLMRWDT
jgi:hypothetical protein